MSKQQSETIDDIITPYVISVKILTITTNKRYSLYKPYNQNLMTLRLAFDTRAIPGTQIVFCHLPQANIVTHIESIHQKIRGMAFEAQQAELSWSCV